MNPPILRPRAGLKTFLLYHLQMLMNVLYLVVVDVTPTLCVPTRKDPTSAAVYEVLKEMAETVQVKFQLCLGFNFCSLVVILEAKLPTVNVL